LLASWCPTVLPLVARQWSDRVRGVIELPHGSELSCELELMRSITAAVRQTASQPLPPSAEGVVPTEVTELVRAVFRAWIVGATDDAELRATLRLLCDATRRQHLPPEQVLIVLKGVCRSVPEFGDTRKRNGIDDRIARAVTMCIEEFFAGTPGSESTVAERRPAT
jgi:hypothetical protein